MKTIENNSLRLTDKEKKVTLYGWVQKKRDLGGVCFIDLRDRSGIVQLVARSSDVYEVASALKSESVLKVEGIVRERESKNKNIPTGDIEVELLKIEVLNSCNDLPSYNKSPLSALLNLSNMSLLSWSCKLSFLA